MSTFKSPEVLALFQQAQRFRTARMFKEAADAYAVVADMAEEGGFAKEAETYRFRALRLHVYVWAEAQWPNPAVTRVGNEIRTFDVFKDHQAVEHAARVSVGKDGRIHVHKRTAKAQRLQR